MSTMNRRRFSLLGLGGFASAVLVACGNDIGDEKTINPTKIPDVPGAPKPTLADMATPGGETEATEATGGGESAGAAVTVHTLDTLKFDPPTLTVSPGTVITVENSGVVQHDFAIDEFGGVLVGPLNGGESGTWTVPADAALGDYVFYCSLPGHRQAGMEGTLTIGEAAPPPAESEASPPAEGGATPAGGEQPPAEEPAPPAAGPVTVHTLDTLKFDPPQISAGPGTVITVENTGFVQHDFAIDEFGGVLVGPLNNGESGDWTVPADAAPGDYVYYCSIPGHRQAGMEGTLTIG